MYVCMFCCFWSHWRQVSSTSLNMLKGGFPMGQPLSVCVYMAYGCNKRVWQYCQSPKVIKLSSVLENILSCDLKEQEKRSLNCILNVYGISSLCYTWLHSQVCKPSHLVRKVQIVRCRWRQLKHGPMQYSRFHIYNLHALFLLNQPTYHRSVKE